MDVVELAGVRRCFGSFVAVEGLTMRVGAGEMFGLLGPNGAGKTTTLKILTTLLPPTAGGARVGGYDVVRQAPEVRRVIGYVPQLLSADGSLTGEENLTLFAKLYDVPRREREARLRQAIALMGLGDAARKLVRTYSGGMIRRLEIAQSMLHEPLVLFLDEPTVGLDPGARRTVWEHLRQVHAAARTTILMTTHLMEEADALCQRVAIMHRGRLVAQGTPAALKASLPKPGASLDDVFIHYTAQAGDGDPGYRETARTRRTLRRLG